MLTTLAMIVVSAKTSETVRTSWRTLLNINEYIFKKISFSNFFHPLQYQQQYGLKNKTYAFIETRSGRTSIHLTTAIQLIKVRATRSVLIATILIVRILIVNQGIVVVWNLVIGILVIRVLIIWVLVIGILVVGVLVVGVLVVGILVVGIEIVVLLIVRVLLSVQTMSRVVGIVENGYRIVDIVRTQWITLVMRVVVQMLLVRSVSIVWIIVTNRTNRFFIFLRKNKSLGPFLRLMIK